jgi:hypothetical protein
MKPALVSVDPQTSPRAGGGKAAVHGRQMLPGAKVFFGKDTIKTVSYIASDALGITIPSGRGGPVDVIVKNPNGQVDTLRRGFFYDNNPPLAFQLSDPTAGKIVTVAKPTFRWKKTSDPDGDEIVYLFVLSDRDDFADSILVEGLKDTVYTLKDTSLASSKQYYWKVIASDTREGYAVSPVGIFATGIITNAGQEVEIPKEFALYQNYPNPFNPSTTISFALPLASRVVIKIYDIVGREVATLIKGELAAGLYRYPFNGSGYSSGMYIYRMSAISVQNGNEQTFTSVKKLLLVK